MNTLRRIRLLFSYDRKTFLLFLEAFLFLGWARILMLLPFTRVAPSLGLKSQETPPINIDQHLPLIKAIARAVNVMRRYTLWDSKCLVAAIAAMRMLQRRQMESTLYLGTAKDENGSLIAHAWLRSGTLILTGADVMKRYVVVEKFANLALGRK